MKKKILVVVASRANYGRIKSVLKHIRAHPDLELQLVVGASALLFRFGSVVDVIRNDGFEPTATAYYVVEGETPTTMAKTTGMAIIELATLFENLAPHRIITVADRHETLATAVAASYMNIVLAHTQGGEVTGSIDESVRHAITRLAHMHFPASELSRERLIGMGEDPESIFCVGCPAMDLIRETDLRLGDLFGRATGVGAPMDSARPYLVVLQHPVTTEYGRGTEQIWETLKAIETLRMQTVWLWPNVDAGSDDISKGLRVFREQHKPDYIHFYRNFPPEEYLRLMNSAACMVGNSSSAIREGAFLGVPAVNIGTRQQGRERGPNVIDVRYDHKEIRNAVERQLEHGRYAPSHIYGDGHAGERVARILAEYEPPVQKRLYLVNGPVQQQRYPGGDPGARWIQGPAHEKHPPFAR